MSLLKCLVSAKKCSLEFVCQFRVPHELLHTVSRTKRFEAHSAAAALRYCMALARDSQALKWQLFDATKNRLAEGIGAEFGRTIIRFACPELKSIANANAA